MHALTRYQELKKEPSREDGAKRKPIKEDEDEDDGKVKDVEDGDEHVKAEVKEEIEA